MKHYEVGKQPPFFFFWGGVKKLDLITRKIYAKTKIFTMIFGQVKITNYHRSRCFLLIIDTNPTATLRNHSYEPRIDLSTNTFSITEK